MAKFTVILITHNNAPHVVKALSSIREQNVGDWECLLVDNGSTDDTVARAEEAIAGDARFQVHRKANEGPSGGRNYGYKLVPGKCDYIAFIDGDDWIRENFLEVMGGYLDAHAEVGLVTCHFARADSEGNLLGPGVSTRNIPNALGFPRRMRTDETRTPFIAFFAVSGQGPFSLYRRAVFAQTTGYEPSFSSHEDTDMFCQMALRAEVHAIPDELYVKREHGANLTRSGNRNPFARSCYDAFRKKWDTLVLADGEQQKMLEQARRYYYTRHVPCRHLVVLARGLRELRHRRDMNHVRWMADLLRSAVHDFFLGYRRFDVPR